MSIEVFRKAVADAGLRKTDQKWLPIWAEKYAQFHRFEAERKLPMFWHTVMPSVP